MAREPIQLVEIVQPFCSRTFGISPCTATGGSCFNTRSTCKDPENFALGPGLSLFFSKGDVGSRSVPGVNYIMPFLVSVSSRPTVINFAGSNVDASGGGTRASVSIAFQDQPHNDRLVDPYRSTRSRTISPMATFWRKWMTRNRYRLGATVRIYDGYSGDALADMAVRQYIITDVSWPTETGQVGIECKDPLSDLEERKAQCPPASPGELAEDITSSQTTIPVANALVSEYPISGTVRINKELIRYAGVFQAGDNIELTNCVRASDRTEASAHEAESAVQECARFTDVRPDEAISALMTQYASVPLAYIPTAAWAADVTQWAPLTRLTTIISEPTGVFDLVAEIMQQCLINLWWNERTSLIDLKVVRGIEAEPDVLTERANLLSGMRIRENPRRRISDVVFNYNLISYVEPLGESTNYASKKVVINLSSSLPEQNGTPSIKTIFSRWITTGAVAGSTAAKLVRAYSDVPREASFSVTTKDRKYSIGDTVIIESSIDLDEFGEFRRTLWTITSFDEPVSGEVIRYTAEDTTRLGRVSYVMPNGSANYTTPEAVPFRNCYIGNNNGLLPDGTEAGVIS